MLAYSVDHFVEGIMPQRGTKGTIVLLCACLWLISGCAAARAEALDDAVAKGAGVVFDGGFVEGQ